MGDSHRLINRGQSPIYGLTRQPDKWGTVTYVWVNKAAPDGENGEMPRVPRIVIPNCPHHVTQRGNNRQDVFFVDDDRAVYLGLLQEEAERHGLRVEG